MPRIGPIPNHFGAKFVSRADALHALWLSRFHALAYRLGSVLQGLQLLPDQEP